jgi:photosystem II stability/assembly factor-like uncharacterized protein
LIISPNWPADQTLFGLWPESTKGYCFTTLIPYISLDGGQTWSQTLHGLPDDCLLTTPLTVSPDYPRDQTLFAGIFGLGIFKSTDGGQLWLPTGTGLSGLMINEIVISPGFARDDTAFVLVSFGTNPPNTLYRSRDGGQTWQLLHVPAKTDETQPIFVTAISPDFEQDQTLLVALSGQGWRLYLSRNGGDQWEFVGELPAGVRRLWVAPLFAQWGTLFAATDHYEGEQELYRSADGGKSWQSVLTGPAAVRQVTFAPEIEQNRPVFALADRLYQSADGGLTWQEVETPSPANPLTLAVSPNFAQDQTLFVGTEQGEVLTLNVSK